MIKILGTCFGFFLLGAALALGMVNWPLRPGYMGAGFLVALAWFTRRYWQQRRNTVGDDPSMSERRTWLYMAGTAMICAYVVIVLLTPGSEVHRATGDTGGFDTWLMLGGGFIAYLILHEGDAHRDERDLAIEAIGNRVGYTSLVVLLIVFLLLLGFAPREMMQRFTHWLIANALLTIIMLASVAQYIAQLICYWRDAKALRARDE